MSTHRTSSRVIGTLFLIVGISVILLCSAALAAARSASTGGHGFQTGSTRVDFIDEAGHFTTDPVIDLAGASPDMPEQRFAVRLQNTGTLGADVTVTSTMMDSGQDSLDDVLHVSLTDETGTLFYQGRPSGLTFESSALPGQFRSFTLSVTWPGGPDDNRYQGQALSLGLQADATPADG
jgi:hypothetical protein